MHLTSQKTSCVLSLSLQKKIQRVTLALQVMKKKSYCLKTVQETLLHNYFPFQKKNAESNFLSVVCGNTVFLKEITLQEETSVCKTGM